MAAGLKVCSASHCTGALRIGSVKVDAGLGVITGFPLAGRVNGPITHGCACAPAEPTIAANIIQPNLFIIDCSVLPQWR